ncbi:hypothetical protein ACHHYP_04117 [Achlya hypogyna]|uniref:Uncharacterized protein n=1 Tax=Achlya hypogyna TaxID=1202772 RepID=A0A1V9Z262_ACHHY|nr:hypothetical protein ACHHYP_04117 [Achlya hypogyna]
MRSARARVAERPKSANVSKRGTLASLLSPRPGNREALMQAPPRWTSASKPAVTRYCLIDKQTSLSPRPASAQTLPGFQPRPSTVEVTVPTTDQAPSEAPPSEPAPLSPSPPTPRRPPASSPTTDCFHVRQARKEAEANAQLLANRIAFLHLEQEKAQMEADKMYMEHCREVRAKQEAERHRAEKAARAQQEERAIQARREKKITIQNEHKLRLQHGLARLQAERAHGARSVKLKRKTIEAERQRKEFAVVQAKIQARHKVVSHEDHMRRQRSLRQQQLQARLEAAQAERIRLEHERHEVAESRVAAMRAKETAMKCTLEIQEFQHRLEMQKCFDTETPVTPDTFSPNTLE